MIQKFKIVFMGTPEFAVPALNALHKSGHCVEMVVTQPDRQKGRGRKTQFSPVKRLAGKLGYPIVQPAYINDKAFVSQIEKLAPHFFVVAAFGQILGEEILNIPSFGAINIHPSLLPKYRGPAPIQWAIINGDKITGLSIMAMEKGLDQGNIFLSKSIEIAPVETAKTLHDKLAQLGGDLLINVLNDFESGTVNPIPQNDKEATYAPLLKKKHGRINWKQSAESIKNFVYGMNPWPGAFTFYQEKSLKIFNVKPIDRTTPDVTPGTVLEGPDNQLQVAAGTGSVSILEIQGASGKRMLIGDFLRGNLIPSGTVLH